MKKVGVAEIMFGREMDHGHFSGEGAEAAEKVKEID